MLFFLKVLFFLVFSNKNVRLHLKTMTSYAFSTSIISQIDVVVVVIALVADIAGAVNVVAVLLLLIFLMHVLLLLFLVCLEAMAEGVAWFALISFPS